jgi:hypothetical protein
MYLPHLRIYIHIYEARRVPFVCIASGIMLFHTELTEGSYVLQSASIFLFDICAYVVVFCGENAMDESVFLF